MMFLKTSKNRNESIPKDKSTCTVCGALCAIKNMNDTRVEESELVAVGN